MPMHYVITAISGNYPDIANHPEKHFFRNKQLISIGIFYPSGDPISLRRLRRGSFAVVYYSFISHILVAAAISERK
jgi:hypothetical protein